MCGVLFFLGSICVNLCCDFFFVHEQMIMGCVLACVKRVEFYLWRFVMW